MPVKKPRYGKTEIMPVDVTAGRHEQEPVTEQGDAGKAGIDAPVAESTPIPSDSEMPSSASMAPSFDGEAALREVWAFLPDEARAEVADRVRSAIMSRKPFPSGNAKIPIPRREDAPALEEYRRRHPDLSPSENKAKAIRTSDEYWEIVKSLGGQDRRLQRNPDTMVAWEALSESLQATDDAVELLRLGERSEGRLHSLRMTSVRAKAIDAIIQKGFASVVDDSQVSLLAQEPSQQLRRLLSTGDLIGRLKRWMVDTYSDWDPYDDGYGDTTASIRTPTTVNGLMEMLEWAIYEGEFIREEIVGASRWDHGQLDKPAKAARRLYLRSDLGKATKALSEAWGIGDIVTRKSTLDMAWKARSQVCNALDHEFGWDEIVRLVSENPRYKAMFEAERNMERGILDRIPENPIDLYPVARSMSRHFVLHIGPTNSGKTHDAMEALGKAPSGVYLAPLRLLAYEQYERLNDNGCPCSLLTGEEEMPVDGARHVASTIEMLDYSSPVEVAVIDEAQMMDDRDRGSHWTEAILGVPASEVHVCLAPEAEGIVKQVVEACGDSWEVVRHERMTPLEQEREPFSFPKDVRKGDAVIVFTRRAVHAVAAMLASEGKSTSMIYGALPYDVRHREAERFASGETEVVVATDAIGMGMNLPVKRVVFLEQAKFDGRDKRFLTGIEIRQIAGRAGRYGIHESGTWVSANENKKMGKRMSAESTQIAKAPIGFVRTLLGVDGTVSQLMRKWSSLDTMSPFSKMDLEREIALATDLEAQLSADEALDIDMKKLVYRFATMPFKENIEWLRSEWLRMFGCEASGVEFPVKVPTGELPSGMDALEAQYAHMDLLHQYCRTFGYSEHYEAIDGRRRLISDRISEMIAGSVFESKRCRECGRPLPWNWPYPMCDPCHERLYPRRRWYDEW